MINFSSISFCNKRALNVSEDSFKGQILDILKKNYYVTIKDRYFYIINQKNIKYVEKNPHILSVKSSGSPYYLFLTQIEERNYCFFIDKKIKEGHKYPRIISSIYRFNEELFSQNTLFDGELLRDKNDNWMYIINNLVIYKGELMKNKTIIYKLDIVYNILTNNYKKDHFLEICPLVVKRLFPNHEFDNLVNNYIPSLEYNVRGIYFETIRNTNNHLYLFPRNYKPMKLNTPNSSNKEIINTQTSISQSSNSNNYNNGSNNSNNGSNSSNSDNKVRHIKKSRREMLDVKRDASKTEELRKRDTLIFMVRKTDKSDIYNLYCIKDDEIIKYGGAHIQNLRTSKYLRKNFINGTDNINMNCSWNSIHSKWQPIDITDQSIDNFCDIEEYLKIKS